MLTFICPHCHQQLKINAEHVGLRGKCNKCGGRIALIGRADAQRPQMASRIAESGEEDTRPATPRQVELARKLGAPATALESLNRAQAETVIVQQRDLRAEHEPPTERQLDYLKRLGLPAEQAAAIRSKAEASRLIDQWLPPPTKAQRDYLERLGATPSQLAALRTKTEAAALIQQFLSQG